MTPARLSDVAKAADKAITAVYNADFTPREQLIALRLAALQIAEDDPEEPNVLAEADAAAVAIRDASGESS